MIDRETTADAQRRFARENDAIAERLADAGHVGLAAVYRDAAREHEACAERTAQRGADART